MFILAIKHQSMFVIHPRKMQKARYLRSLFLLVLVFLLNSWFVTNINAYPMQLINSWATPPPMSLMRTRKGMTINYRLDTWSQYDNPEEGAEFEGDIHQLSKSSKTITTNKNLLWPNGIVNYYVHSSIANEPIKFAMLESALHTIMSKTCIKFVRIQEYAKVPANSWINITGHRKGCFSNLGRNKHGPTSLNLDVNICFQVIGHAIHEMMHSLGVYHEHMRPDRDEYISIIWDNIKKENVFNFRLLNNSIVTNHELPYDYDSIMHYSMTAFSIDKSFPTIIPKSSYVEIGQRSHLSHYDIQKLLISYNCNAVRINKLKNKKLKKKKLKKLSGRRKLPQPQPLQKSLNKTVIETEVKSQMPTIIIHNSVLNKLDNAELKKPMDRFNQVALFRSMYPVQSNYHFVPLSPIYSYINFYLYKK